MPPSWGSSPCTMLRLGCYTMLFWVPKYCNGLLGWGCSVLPATTG